VLDIFCLVDVDNSSVVLCSEEGCVVEGMEDKLSGMNSGRVSRKQGINEVGAETSGVLI